MYRYRTWGDGALGTFFLFLFECDFVVWYSSRSNILYQWIDKQTNLIPLFIDQDPKEILKVIKYIKPGVKSAAKQI